MLCFFDRSEPEEWWGVLREDAKTSQRSEPSRNHSRNDQEEGEEQKRAAAPHTGDFWEEVIPPLTMILWLCSLWDHVRHEGHSDQFFHRKSIWLVFPSEMSCQTLEVKWWQRFWLKGLWWGLRLFPWFPSPTSTDTRTTWTSRITSPRWEHEPQCLYT